MYRFHGKRPHARSDQQRGRKKDLFHFYLNTRQEKVGKRQPDFLAPHFLAVVFSLFSGTLVSLSLVVYSSLFSHGAIEMHLERDSNGSGNEQEGNRVIRAGRKLTTSPKRYGHHQRGFSSK